MLDSTECKVLLTCTGLEQIVTGIENECGIATVVIPDFVELLDGRSDVQDKHYEYNKSFEEAKDDVCCVSLPVK